ncbi:MAG: UDP-glucose 4-epimerase GalE, partial [Myxococcota bacterium]
DDEGSCLFYNLGTGRPHSVREVITSVGRVTGKLVPTREDARRPGDPPVLYADHARAVRELDWQIEHRELDSIVETAWRWHRDHPGGYAARS